MDNQPLETPPPVPTMPTPTTPQTPPTAQSPQTPPSSVPPTNGLAIAGLVVGIVAFLSGWAPIFGLLVSITAVILSILALRKGRSQKGMAIAGLITGGLGLLWSLLVSALFIIGIIAGINSFNEIPSTAKDTTSQNQESENDSTMSNSKDVAGYTITANKVTRDYKPQNAISDDTTEYVVVNITVKNNSNLMSAFVTSNMSLNADGKSSPVSFVSADPSITNADIPTGKTATGNLVFQIPKDAAMLMLEYKHTSIGLDGKQSEKTTSIHVE